MSLHDYSQFFLNVNSSNPTSVTIDRAEKWKHRASSSVFGTQKFKFLLKQYKYVKFNWVRYDIRIILLSYFPQVQSKPEPPGHRGPVTAASDSAHQADKGSILTNFGVAHIQGKIPFWLLWNKDCDVPANPSPDLLRDSSHSRQVFCGGKSAKFFVKVPAELRKYVDCTHVNTIDPNLATSNNISSYLSKAVNSYKETDWVHKLPSMFFGTCGYDLDDLSKYITISPDYDYPFRFLVTFKVSASCTFKGFNDLTYSFTVSETENKYPSVNEQAE